MLMEPERAGVDQEGGPDQIQARRASCRLTVVELGCRAREIGGGPAQAKGGTAEQGRICVPNQTPARAAVNFRLGIVTYNIAAAWDIPTILRVCRGVLRHAPKHPGPQGACESAPGQTGECRNEGGARPRDGQQRSVRLGFPAAETLSARLLPSLV